MMKEAIQNFSKQFEVEFEIENREEWKKYERFCVVGMGGSALAADLFTSLHPSVDLLVHRNYGLPELSQDQWQYRLVIISSYSGNTEEPLDAFAEAQKKNLPLAVISVGGKLLVLAKKYNVPYVQIPDTGIQPRNATGFMFLALLKLLGDEQTYEKTKLLAFQLKPGSFEEEGRQFAQQLRGRIPVIYSSQKNATTAYAWKIKFNESAKIPAFCNAFPELNHNEMNGFDVVENTEELSGRFAFIFLKDSDDHPQVKKRMKVLQELYEQRGFSVYPISLEGSSGLFKMFSSLVTADWIAYFSSQFYNTEPEQVPMVEEFKRRIQ